LQFLVNFLRRSWKIVKQKLVPLSAEDVCGESVVTKVLADVDAGEDNRNAQDRAQAGQGQSLKYNFGRTFRFLRRISIFGKILIFFSSFEILVKIFIFDQNCVKLW